MSGTDAEALRAMVREVLREVLPAGALRRETPSGAAPPTDVRRVRVRDDRDLADVVTQVLDLAEDPAGLADLRAGRVRFTLLTDRTPTAPADSPGDAPADSPIDVERGAVTERLIQRAAREERSLRIGPRAVITPLARDRARALGVTIHRTTSANRRETR